MENCCEELPKGCNGKVSIICGANFFDLVSMNCGAGNDTRRTDIHPLAIPNYQREYCWRKKQVEGLLGSIWKFPDYGGGCLHLGTIVVHEETDQTDQTKQKWWNVVDGQQRAITLSILYKLYKCKDDVSIDFPLLNVGVDKNEASCISVGV